MDRHPHPATESAPAGQPLRQAHPALEPSAPASPQSHQPAALGGSHVVLFGALASAAAALHTLGRALKTGTALSTLFGQRLKIRHPQGFESSSLSSGTGRNRSGISAPPVRRRAHDRALCGSHLVRFGVAAGLPAALTGCGTVDVPAADPSPPAVVFPEKPRQAEALAVIRTAWGQPEVPMRLEWVEGDALDCGGGAFHNSTGACVFGTVEWETPPLVRVAWEPGDSFSTTTLAHELCHLYFGDPDHLAECGTVRPASRVLPAEQALREAGL